MNLQDALSTANWLLEREAITEVEPQQLLRIRKMRDTLYLLYAACGISEIMLQALDDVGGG